MSPAPVPPSDYVTRRYYVWRGSTRHVDSVHKELFESIYTFAVADLTRATSDLSTPLQTMRDILALTAERT
jgi:hypothetical protein